MVSSLRRQFNENFTKENYKNYLQELHSVHPGDLEFRVAETPIFIDKIFTKQMINACESIVDIIVQPNFKKLTDNAIPKDIHVPGENAHTQFIAFDFGICENEKGELEPQLIEMQGFPTLFAYQVFHDEITLKHFDIPQNYSSYLNGFEKASYLQLLKDIIVAKHNPENVILLEIFPEKQKTRIDFAFTQDYLHIPIICLTSLIKEGTELFYEKEGRRDPGEKNL